MPIEHEGQTYYSVEERDDHAKSHADEQVKGLKSNNTELLETNSKLKADNKKFTDLGDIDEIRDTMDLVRNNEDIKTIREGGVDSLVNSRMERERAETQERVTSLENERDDFKNKYSGLQDSVNRNTISDEIRAAATKAGIRPEAMDDAIARGLGIFTLGGDGKVEARDTNGDLVKTEDDRLVNPKIFIESLKKSAPHYWPASDGAGSGKGGDGSGQGSKGGLTDAMQAALKAGDQRTYQRLRREQRQLRA